MRFIRLPGSERHYRVLDFDHTELGEVKMRRERYPWAQKGYATWYAYRDGKRLEGGHSTRRAAAEALTK
jgi:hypothetical protein